MNAPHPTASPLRQRMLEDMRMRRLAPKTQTAYIPDGQVKFPHPWPPQIPPGRTAGL